MTLNIDCSMGEGGGSLVRISTALASAIEKPLRLFNIRAKRTHPGLRAQHIEAINAITQFSGMNSDKLKVGNTETILTKENEQLDKATVQIGTAGSINLVAQAVLFYSLSQKRDLVLKIDGGATHGKWAPSVEYIQNITHNFIEKMQKDVLVNVERFGFYPKGGAKAIFQFKGHNNLSPLNLIEKGKLDKISLYSTVSKTLAVRDVAKRQIQSFLKKVRPTVEIDEHTNYVDSLCPGTGLTVIGHYSSGTRMGCFVPGERRLTAEQVGELCSQQWKENNQSTATVDIYSADQLIVPMALAEGKSEITTSRISNHTKTNIDLVKRFIDRKIIIKEKSNCFHISVEG